jgi:hypothetical protein
MQLRRVGVSGKRLDKEQEDSLENEAEGKIQNNTEAN